MSWPFINLCKTCPPAPKCETDIYCGPPLVNTGINTNDSIVVSLQKIDEAMGSIPPGTVSYKVYTAVLNQTDTNPPVALIMENTIGPIVISYVSAGIYLFTLAGAFTTNKTIMIKLSNGENGNGTNYVLKNLTTDSFSLIGNVGSGGADNQLVNFPIEIRVYN